MERRYIKELRVGLGLSQERFARLLGVSLQSVRRWESGLARPLPVISMKLEELQREAQASQRRGGVPMARIKDRSVASVEIGLGGLFKGVGNLLDLVSKMAEESKEEASHSGEFEAMRGKLKGVYGFSVRVGLGGTPVIEQFGNIRETDSGPVVAETREPLTDVLDEGGQLTVIVELPGVEEKDIQVRAEGDILEVSATTKAREYHKEVLLPAPVDPTSLVFAYRNGVLEVTLAKQKPAAG